MADYVLQNPRKGIERATIYEAPDGWASLRVEFQRATHDVNGEMYRSLRGAKMVYTREYQSVRWGFDKPIWKKES